MTEEEKNKQATEETDTVQRLLEFLNLNSTPGVLNLFKIYYFKFPDYPPLKHPPTKPPKKYDKDGFASVKEYLWYKGQDGKPIFIGKISEYLPRLKDFIKYFGFVSEYSFRYYKPEQLNKLYNIWDSLVRRFSDIAQANTQKERDDAYSKLKDFLRECQEDYRKGFDMSEKELAGNVLLYKSYQTISLDKTVKPGTIWEIHEINTFILDFWTKHWKLLPLLRQCRYCGIFWVIRQKEEKGRPKECYCGKKCSRSFNKNTRDYDNIYKKTKRDEAKKDLKENMLKEIIDTCYVKKAGGKYRRLIDKREAEEVYKRIPRKNKKDMDTFKQTLENERFYVQ